MLAERVNSAEKNRHKPEESRNSSFASRRKVLYRDACGGNAKSRSVSVSLARRPFPAFSDLP